MWIRRLCPAAGEIREIANNPINQLAHQVSVRDLGALALARHCATDILLLRTHAASDRRPLEIIILWIDPLELSRVDLF